MALAMNRTEQETLHRELDFVLTHTHAALSPQSRRLLTYLGDALQGVDPDQHLIARDVLGLGCGFDPGVDPNVRVAVSRLRTALSAFYDTHGGFRAFRLTLPVGRYQLRVVRNDPVVMPGEAEAGTTPVFAWTVTSDGTPEANSLRHRIDRLLSARIVEAPLIHDGALRADRLPPTTGDAALEDMRQSGKTMLAEISVGARTAPIRLTMTCPRERHLPMTRCLPPVGDNADIDRVVQRIVVGLTDPLYSPLPKRLADAYPATRLALALDFFRFMTTQDRRLLRTNLDALQSAAQSRLASPLIKALHIDAMRANYAFATGEVAEFRDDIVERAWRNFETDPYQPYSALSYAYAAIATGANHVPDMSCQGRADIRWEGSLAEDRDLYQTLLAFDGNQIEHISDSGSGSFFSEISLILKAIRDDDFELAASRAFAPRRAENFWTRTLQSSIAADLGRRSLSRQIFAQLISENPGAEDFAGRAIVTMIPDEHVHARILHNLANSC